MCARGCSAMVVEGGTSPTCPETARSPGKSFCLQVSDTVLAKFCHAPLLHASERQTCHVGFFLSRGLGGRTMKGRCTQDGARYASGRKKPTSRTLAKLTGVNSKFHTLGLAYSGKKKPKTKQNPLRRELQQIGFPEVCSWSNARCKAVCSPTCILLGM